MNEQLKTQIEKEIAGDLAANEMVTDFGFFRRLPTISMLILTRGMARFFTKEFLVVVTDQRLMLIPMKKIAGKTVYDDMINIDCKDIKYGVNAFNDLILRINVPGKRYPLKIRYVLGFNPDWTERLRFLTALEGLTSSVLS